MENNAQPASETPIKPNRFLIMLTYTPTVQLDIYIYILVKFFHFTYESAAASMTQVIKDGVKGLKLLTRDIAETKVRLVRETMKQLCPQIDDILNIHEVHERMSEAKK